MKSRSSEAAHIAWTLRVVERGRFNRNLRRLRRTLPGLWLLFVREGYALSRAFPMLGVWEALEGLGCFAVGPEVRFLRRFKLRIAAAVCVWCKNRMTRGLLRKYPDAPGWNDYYMALWMMTGETVYVQELYSRAVCVPSPWASELENLTFSTARWMLSSVRSQFPDFHAALSAVEVHYGVAVLPVLPAPPGARDAFVPSPAVPSVGPTATV